MTRPSAVRIQPRGPSAKLRSVSCGETYSLFAHHCLAFVAPTTTRLEWAASVAMIARLKGPTHLAEQEFWIFILCRY